MEAMTSTTAFAEGRFAHTPEFEQKLNRLAVVAVKVGLGLGAGQQLVMTANLESAALARRITEQA